MKTKILVHGKSQSRTALGIINAYLRLYPDATPSDLQEAFPKSLNRRCTADQLIIPVAKTLGYEKMFFEHEDELIIFSTGEMYALVEVWDKEDFNAICKHAKQFGIEVAKAGTKPFEKGSFELEYVIKRRFKWWWILPLILLLLLIICCCCLKKCSDKYAQNDVVIVENVMQPTSPISDYGNSITVALPDGSVLHLSKSSSEYKLFSFLNCPDTQVDADKSKGWLSMDDIHFETGKAVLLPESGHQLRNIARMLHYFPNSHIKIGGYTDDTGSDEINMKLSDERAKATFDRLVSLGVAADRMAYEGYGSNYPVSIDDKAANRRVDIRVTQK